MSAIDSKELEPDVATSPSGGVLDDSGGEKAKKRAQKTEESRSGGGGGDGQQQGQQLAKKSKGRLVPGSLVLTSLSASALPNTEKGAFSKQVCRLRSDARCEEALLSFAQSRSLTKCQRFMQMGLEREHREHTQAIPPPPRRVASTSYPVRFKQDPYIVVKWGGQEVRTSVKRDSGKECSWPKEELALIVRTKKQLQEPVEVEVSGHPR